MFKTAASKLAHNTTLPVLGGNQDLKPLQDLITAEKTVLIALQKLSADYSKAAESLRIWGHAEGDDLGDILNASTALLIHFSSALSQYAAHGHPIREHLKAIRSREEALDELRRRRRTVHRKADDAEKKLNKMGPEHKNMDTQTELLYRLQDEIRSLDSEIMTEEAQLGDFKRACARKWLGLKFGGLLECCEKGTIIGEYGKLLVAEIPEDITQPGMPRSLYYGHSKINSLVNEATRGIEQVTFSAAPSDARGPPLPLPPKEGALDSPIGDGFYPPKGPSFEMPPGYLPSINTLPTPSKGPAFEPPSSTQHIDDFGARQDPNVSKFATFPVKLRQDSLFSSQVPPSLNARHGIEDSFSLSIAEALEAKKDAVGEDPSQPWRGRLSGEGSKLPPISSTAPPAGKIQSSESTNPWATPPAQDQTLSVQPRPVSTLSDDDDALLAYMTSAEAETSSTSDNHGDHLTHVERKSTPPPTSTNYSKDIQSESDNRSSRPASIKVKIDEGDDQSELKPKPIGRVPPPSFDPEKEERALNAAAARELSREIEIVDFTPPKISSLTQQETNSQQSHEEQEPRGRSQNLLVHSGEAQEDREGSPLAPPSAPFTHRAVSPNPFAEPPRTAAQAYASAYQSQQGSPNPYDYPQDQYNSNSPPSNLPPRLQAYQHAESQMVPPRFQGLRTGSSPVPPRFQGAHAQNSQNPPMSYTDAPSASAQDNRYNPIASGNTAPAEQSRSSIESPYLTPGEYPANSGANSPRLANAFVPNSSTSSPSGNVTNSPQPQYQAPPRPQQSGSPNLSASPPPTSTSTSPLVPAGGRTISAAAFKRPHPLPSSSMDAGNFPDPRRTFSISQNPPRNDLNSNMNAPPAQAPAQQFAGSYGYGGGAPPAISAIPPSLGVGMGSGSPNNATNNNIDYQQRPHRVSRDLPPPPPGAAAPRPESEYDYQYDYISAYQHGEQDSPKSAELPLQGQGQGQGRVMSGGGGYYGGGVAPGQVLPQQQQLPQGSYGQMGTGGPPPGFHGQYGTGRYGPDPDRSGLR